MDKIYDVIIIGSGPAGLSAAIYCARGNLSCMVIEKEVYGGKLSKTYEIDNYPGVGKISGAELAQKYVDQVKSFNIEIITADINRIENLDTCKKLSAANGKSFLARNIIVATGASENRLNLERADEFTGRGISYCAVCDGFFYRKKDVVIIGGGNSALEEALYLAKLCSSVTIIIRRDVFRADRSVIDKVLSSDRIRVIYKSLPEKLIIEDDVLKGLIIRNVEDGSLREIECTGIFPYIGQSANTSFLDKSILDSKGYMIVNPDMSTAIEGIYGAGDVIAKGLRQVVTAANDGAIAANSIINRLS